MTTDWTPPGPGPWQQDSAHSPAGATRIICDVYPPNFDRGFSETFARYGSLLDCLVMKTVNGFTYQQPQPFNRPGPDGPRSEEYLGGEIGRRNGVADAAVANRIWRDDMTIWDAELKPQSIARHRALYDVDLSGLSDDEVSSHLEACIANLEEMVYQHHRMNLSAIFPVGDFVLTAAPMVGRPPASLLALLDGYSDVSGAVPPEMVAPLLAVRANPDAIALLEADGDPADRLNQLCALVPEVAEFVAATGYRIGEGFDVKNPTIGERPILVLGKLAGALTASPSTARTQADQLAAELREGLDDDQRVMWDDLLGEARRVYRLRDERGLYSDVSALGVLRLAMLELGRRLVARGQLDRAELALELGRDELAAAAAGNGPSSAELEGRVALRVELDHDGPPRHLGPPAPQPPSTDGLPPALARIENSLGFMIMAGILGELDEPVGDDVLIGGISAAAGVYEGPARHISEIDDLFLIEPGDVLVAATTGEAFNSFIHLLGAIVTDHGSFASHAGIVAREMGFPAVVGTTNATSRIPAGARVRVDGNAGEIHVLP
jgi:phosphohistidine swiveling domain-containing protein